MTKPWYSAVPDGAPISTYWEARNAEQETVLKSRVADKVEKIEEAVATSIITKDIGDARKKEFASEERLKLKFFTPDTIGQRIDTIAPVLLRNSMGQPVHTSGKALVEKVLAGQDVGRGAMEFLAQDVEIPVELVAPESAPPVRESAPPVVAPVPAPAAPVTPVTPPPAPVQAAPEPPAELNDLPPPAPDAQEPRPQPTPEEPEKAATPGAEPPKTETVAKTPGTRGRRAAGPPAPAFQPREASTTVPVGDWDVRVTNATDRNLVVAVDRNSDGKITLRILPDVKISGENIRHVRRAIQRYEGSPSSEQETDLETVSMSLK